MMTKTRRTPALTLMLTAAVATAALAPLAPARAEATNPNGVAVIIGNADYEHRDVPDVTFAHRDADAFRGYVVDVLGFDPENIIDVRDATRRELFDALGTKRDLRSLLWSYLDPDGGSEVVVFYSGHGVPGVNDGQGYLLPVDADPQAAENDGYPIDLLYRNVGGLTEASSVRVYLDACFSGGSHAGGLIRHASPVYVEADLPEGVGDKVTSLAAASGKQIASWDEEARHGLFTHHLLDALYGGGDADGDGRVTAAEAKRYLDRHMTRAARRQHRRIQQASLAGVEDAVLASSPAGGAFPARPGTKAAGQGAVPLAKADEGRETAKTAVASEAPSPPALPAETPASVEEALGLTFEQRMLVQHGLTALGEDVGRADGVFGRRTRAGLRSYQQEKGLAETGYLTAELRDALVRHGEAHAKEREEAVRRADDEAYAKAKRLNTPAGYRAYLERGGRHEAEARVLLEEVSKPKWETGKTFRECMDCPEMVVVSAGSFEMGSPPSEEGRFRDEGPVRHVSVAQPFAVGVYEVTFREWDTCRRDGGCSHYPGDEGWGRGERPVVNVSWNDAREYVRWLSRKTGNGYRLLSEAEWEFAARAGSTEPFHFGSTLLPQQASYDARVVYGSGGKGRSKGRTEPVGSFPANAFGLHDVHGNVWEWVEDCWHDTYADAPSHGGVWTRGGDCEYRVLRGGSWVSPPQSLRSAVRGRSDPEARSYYQGFRVARTLD